MSEDLILSSEDRNKLDGIVSEMISNGESDEYIQGVVNDFKGKYSKKKDFTESNFTSEEQPSRSDSWLRRNVATGFISLGNGAESLVGGILSAADMINTTSLSYAFGEEGEAIRKLVEAGKIENRKYFEPIGDVGDYMLDDAAQKQVNNLLTAGYTQDEIERGFLGSMMDGNVGAGLGLLGNSMMQQVPQLALAASTGGAGIGFLGTSAAGQAYHDVEDNPLYTESERIAYASLMGMTEYAAEKIFQTDVNMLRKAFGKDALDDVLRKDVIKKNIFKAVPKGVKSTLEEGFEEGIVTIVDQLTRSAIEGVDRFDAMELAESMILGSLMGGTIYGLTRSRGALGTSETMEERKSLDELDDELKQKLEDETLSEEEAAILRKGREEIAKKKADLIQKDADFYKQFSEEDAKRVAEIDALVKVKMKKKKSLSTKEAEALVEKEINDLINEKLDIENRYRDSAVQTEEDVEEVVAEEVTTEEAPVVQQETETKEAPQESVYQLPDTQSEIKEDFEIVDNRNFKENLEIDDSGYGKWYVRNKKTGSLVAAPTKAAAEKLAKDPKSWDYGEGAPLLEQPAPKQEAVPAPQPQPTEPVQEVDSEEVAIAESEISDAEFRIEDLQSEIEIEKGNIKEAKEEAKKKIAKVRKSKLSKQKKLDKIEEIKAELEDTLDELNGNIGIYKEDIKGFKSEIRKAKRRADKARAAATKKAAPKAEEKSEIKEIISVLNDKSLSMEEKIQKLVEQDRLVTFNGKALVDVIGGRDALYFKVGGVVIPFYRSSKGTDDKTAGVWYPFFFPTSGWLAKAGADNYKEGYGNPIIKEIGEALSENFKYDSPKSTESDLIDPIEAIMAVMPNLSERDAMAVNIGSTGEKAQRMMDMLENWNDNLGGVKLEGMVKNMESSKAKAKNMKGKDNGLGGKFTDADVKAEEARFDDVIERAKKLEAKQAESKKASAKKAAPKKPVAKKPAKKKSEPAPAKAPPADEVVEEKEPSPEEFPSARQVRSINATVDSRQNTHTAKLVETTEDGKEIIYDIEIFRNPRAGEVTFSIAKRVPGKEARVRTYKDFTGLRKQVNRIAAKKNVREDMDFKLRAESRMQAESTRKEREATVIDSRIKESGKLTQEQIDVLEQKRKANANVERKNNTRTKRSVTIVFKGVEYRYMITNIPGQKHLGYGVLHSRNRRTIFDTREQYNQAIESILFSEEAEITSVREGAFWKDQLEIFKTTGEAPLTITASQKAAMENAIELSEQTELVAEAVLEGETLEEALRIHAYVPNKKEIIENLRFKNDSVINEAIEDYYKTPEQKLKDAADSVLDYHGRQQQIVNDGGAFNVEVVREGDSVRGGGKHYVVKVQTHSFIADTNEYTVITEFYYVPFHNIASSQASDLLTLVNEGAVNGMRDTPYKSTSKNHKSRAEAMKAMKIKKYPKQTKEKSQLTGLNKNNVEKSDILKSLSRVREFLGYFSPGTKIVIHNNRAEFDDAMDNVSTTGSKLQEEAGRMVVNKNTGALEIHINLDAANERTAIHEAFHVFFATQFGQNPVIARDLARKLSFALRKGNKSERAMAQELNDFISNYDQEAQPEEMLAELSAILSSEGKTIEGSTMQKIARALREFLIALADRLKIDNKFVQLMKFNSAADSSAQEAVSFMNSFVRAMEGSIADVETSPYNESQELDLGKRILELSSLSDNYKRMIAGFTVDYMQDSDIVKEAILNGDIELNVPFENIHGHPLLLHAPDNASVASITSGEKLLVENKGGFLFPLRFPGAFWASTKDLAFLTAEEINKSRRLSKDGVARMVLVAGRKDKLLSSTVNANGAINILSEMAVQNELLTEEQLDKVYSDVYLSMFQTNNNKNLFYVMEKRIDVLAKKQSQGVSDSSKALENLNKDLESLQKAGVIKLEQTTKHGQKVYKILPAKVNGKEALEKIREVLLPENSAFDSRRHISDRFIATYVQALDGRGKDQLSKITGLDKITKDSMTDFLSETLTEPIIKDVETGMAYAVLEIDSDVEAVRTTGTDMEHESYPYILKVKDPSKKVKIKVFDKPYNPHSYETYDLSKDVSFPYYLEGKEDMTKGQYDYQKWLHDKAAKTVLPTSGMSAVVSINPTEAQINRIRKSYEENYPKPATSKVRKERRDLYEAKINKSKILDDKIIDWTLDTFMQDKQSPFGYASRIKAIAMRLAIEDGVAPSKAGQSKFHAPYLDLAKEAYDKDIDGKLDTARVVERSQLPPVPPRNDQGGNQQGRKDAWSFIKGLASNFSGYSENQKKARTYVESMESQNNVAKKEVRDMAESLSKVLKTREAMELANEYLENPDERDMVADQIRKLPNGERIIALLDGVRAYIDNGSMDLLNDPNIRMPISKEYKAVRKMEKHKEGAKKIYEVYDTNTGEVLYSKLTKETAEEYANSNTLRDVIKNNLGKYLTTSYRFFKDAKYKITDKIRNKAIQEEYEIARLRKLKALIDAGVEEQDALDLVSSPDVQRQTMQEAADSIDEYIRDIEALRGDSNYVFSGISASGLKIPKSRFQRRKDIPDHIQRLLGKEGDPITRFIDTAISINNIKYRSQMITGISEALGADIIKDEVTRGEKGSGQWKFIDDPYSYLNGKWVHVELAEMLDRKPLLQSDVAFYDGYFKVLKVMRKSKVVWNIPTWRKNLTGGWFFIAANGYVNPEFVKDLKARTDRMLKGEADPEIEALIKEMATLGLIGADVNANMIDVSDAAINMIVDPDEVKAQSLLTKMFNKLKKYDQRAAEKYGSVDDYTKLIIYRKEKEVFSQKLFGKSYSELNEAQQKSAREGAAEFVKQNTPTFSRLPKWHTTLAKLPFGDFISFKLEAYRSIFNNASNAVEDIKKSNDTSLSDAQRKAYSKAGYSRLMGTVMTLGARAVIPGLLTALFLGDDDEDLAGAAMKLRANWMEGHSLVVSGIDKDGNITFYDYSMEDPYGEVTDLLINPTDGFKQIGDMLTPNMAVKMVFNMLEGKNQYGYDIADKMDPMHVKAWKYMNYTLKSVVYPPFISSTYRDFIKKQDKGFYEEAGDFGVNLGKRTIIRDYKVNANKQFYYMAREYKFGEPYYKLEGARRRKRMQILDELREVYMAIQTISAAKGNPKLLMDANKSLSRFNKIERLYIKTGKTITQ